MEALLESTWETMQKKKKKVVQSWRGHVLTKKKSKSTDKSNAIGRFRSKYTAPTQKKKKKVKRESKGKHTGTLQKQGINTPPE
ncbi:hypothetical protein ACFXTO_003840 [Malus domestica]